MSVDIDFEKEESDVKVSKYLYEYDGDKVYKMHTIRTDGKTGSVHSVICPDCKKEMMKAEEYYCPYCHA